MCTTSGAFVGPIESHIFQLFAGMNWIPLDLGNRINADVDETRMKTGQPVVGGMETLV